MTLMKHLLSIHLALYITACLIDTEVYLVDRDTTRKFDHSSFRISETDSLARPSKVNVKLNDYGS